MATATLPAPTAIQQLFRDVFAGSRALTQSALLMLVFFALCLALPLVDDRLFNGINVWHKPAKFFLSISVLLATVAWALSLLPENLRQHRSVRWPIAAMIGASWLELAYITFRAARAEGSHYNVDTPLESALYAAMGVGALTITLSSAVIGFIIWRHRNGDIWREAAGLGLVSGAVLGTLTASVLSTGAGHWIGGDQTDATGLPLFFWSTTGGDLRVAHFVGLHAMQVVPFAALSGKRSVVYMTTLAIAVLTAAVFLQAMMGMPLFRL